MTKIFAVTVCPRATTRKSAVSAVPIDLAMRQFIDVIAPQEFYSLGDPPLCFFGTQAMRYGDDDCVRHEVPPVPVI